MRYFIIFLLAVLYANISYAELQFKVTIDSNFTIDPNNKELELHLKSNTQYDYTLKHTKKGTECTLNSLAIQTWINDEKRLDMFVNSEFLQNTAINGIVKKQKISELSEGFRKQWTDSIGKVLGRCNNGDIEPLITEQENTPFAGKGAQRIIDSGILYSLFLFHPVYKNENSWQSDIQFAIGDGAMAHGTATYTKTEETNDTITFNVKASMTPNLQKESLVVKEGNMALTGQEQYSKTDKEWKGGSLNIQVEYPVYIKDSLYSKVNGTMNLSCEPVL